MKEKNILLKSMLNPIPEDPDASLVIFHIKNSLNSFLKAAKGRWSVIFCFSKNTKTRHCRPWLENSSVLSYLTLVLNIQIIKDLGHMHLFHKSFLVLSSLH